ncbi:MAG: hypothetical protein KDA67_04360 [Rhodobacteraceae bacterium]|nr:hypothetical protein [Paracoccaceae bacterium]
MIAGIRLFVIAFVVLSVIYVYLSIRQRWQARNELEAEFDAGGVEGDRDTYIEEGMREYQSSLRRKLILGVYVVPLLVVATLIYVMNYM